MHEQAIQTSSVDTDPIEARVVDEALKILGPNGEKWIPISESFTRIVCHLKLLPSLT